MLNSSFTGSCITCANTIDMRRALLMFSTVVETVRLCHLAVLLLTCNCSHAVLLVTSRDYASGKGESRTRHMQQQSLTNASGDRAHTSDSDTDNELAADDTDM
jgi:hypothetical protein